MIFLKEKSCGRRKEVICQEVTEQDRQEAGRAVEAKDLVAALVVAGDVWEAMQQVPEVVASVLPAVKRWNTSAVFRATPLNVPSAARR